MASMQMKAAQKTHWTESLFVEGADAYMPALQAAGDRAEAEAGVVARLLDEHAVPGNGRVLDVACGLGRHSVPLARRGYEVTGVDISPTFIERARQRAVEASVRVSFVVGDMRHLGTSLGPDVRFDAFIQMFTANGYYGRDGDLELYRDLHGMAPRDALLLIITTTNRDWLLAHFKPELSEESGGVVHLQSRRWGANKSTVKADWGRSRSPMKNSNRFTPSVPTFTSTTRRTSAYSSKRLIGRWSTYIGASATQSSHYKRCRPT